MIDADAKENTNATIEPGFLDYWIGPDNELACTLPGEGRLSLKTLVFLPLFSFLYKQQNYPVSCLFSIEG